MRYTAPHTQEFAPPRHIIRIDVINYLIHRARAEINLIPDTPLPMPTYATGLLYTACCEGYSAGRTYLKRTGQHADLNALRTIVEQQFGRCLAHYQDLHMRDLATRLEQLQRILAWSGVGAGRDDSERLAARATVYYKRLQESEQP